MTPIFCQSASRKYSYQKGYHYFFPKKQNPGNGIKPCAAIRTRGVNTASPMYKVGGNSAYPGSQPLTNLNRLAIPVKQPPSPIYACMAKSCCWGSCTCYARILGMGSLRERNEDQVALVSDH